MNKNEVVKQIVLLMQENDISLGDIRNQISEELQKPSTMGAQDFDLLCMVHSTSMRVRLESGKNLISVGVFPFAGASEYLYFQETEGALRCETKEQLLPTVGFFERVYPIRKELNEVLASLGEPLLQGSYFAKDDRNRQLNWIVNFDDNPAGKLAKDTYGGTTKAKIRYVGYGQKVCL